MTAAERRETQRLLAALADGDRNALEPLYGLLWPVVRDFVRRRLPLEDAEDVAQSALIKLFARASEFDPQRDALCFVLGVALWEVRTARRRRERRREAPLDSLERPPMAPTSPEAATIQADLEQALSEILGELRASDREALLAYAEGERPTGAVFRKRLQRALTRLRLAWRSNHAD